MLFLVVLCKWSSVNLTLLTSCIARQRNASWLAPVQGLHGFPSFNTSDPLTIMFAKILDRQMSAFAKIDGVGSGMGSSGMVRQEMLQAMVDKPRVSLSTPRLKPRLE